MIKVICGLVILLLFLRVYWSQPKAEPPSKMRQKNTAPTEEPDPQKTLSICSPLISVPQVEDDYLQKPRTYPFWIHQVSVAVQAWDKMQLICDHPETELHRLLHRPFAQVKLLVTRTGVVGFYTTEMIDVKIMHGETYGYMKPTEGVGYCTLPHYEYTTTRVQQAYQQFQLSGLPTKQFLLAPDEQYYFRTVNLTQHKSILALLPSFIPREQVRSLNLYISKPGMITNMHYDDLSGFMLQLRGAKTIYLFPPEYHSLMNLYPTDGPLRRRSRFDREWSQTLLDNYPDLLKLHGCQVTLNAGDFLYIPKEWCHTVKSLPGEDAWTLVGALITC